MSIVATGSKVSRQNALIILIMCVAFGGYFAYDGHISEDYQRRHVEWNVQADDFNNPVEFAYFIRLGDPVGTHILNKMSASGQALIANAAANSPEFAQQLAAEMNALLDRTDLFNGCPLFEFSPETIALQNMEKKQKEDIAVLNHMMLIDAFPNHIKHSTWRDGRATANLQLNRYYGPAVCAIAAVYFLISFIRIPSYRIEADATGLKVNAEAQIPYTAIKQIDNRDFEKKGKFTITYDDQGGNKSLVLSRAQYDNLKAILDEIIKQTGAAPAEEDSDTADNAEA